MLDVNATENVFIPTILTTKKFSPVFAQKFCTQFCWCHKQLKTQYHVSKDNTNRYAAVYKRFIVHKLIQK